MLNHPLLEPKLQSVEKRVANLAHHLSVSEPAELGEHPPRYQRRWLAVLAIYGLIAILAFMLVPVVTITFGDVTTNYLENIKDLVNFGAPTLLIVAVLVGVTGYFGYARIAWWLSFGFWTSIVVLTINIATRVNWLNLGIFWIIVGTLVGLFIGCAFELVVSLHWRREKYLVMLLLIGMLATAGATLAAFQNSTKKGTPVVTLTEAQRQLAFPLFKPETIPGRYSIFTPKIFIINREFHMYYGDESYPPPPVLDFLKGLEIIESGTLGDSAVDSLGNNVEVTINGLKAMYRETRGRSILQWTQGTTSILVISYSPINGKELVDLARSFTAFQP